MIDYDTALYLWISVGVFGFVAVMQMLIKNWLVTIIACGSPLFLWGLATGQTGLISAAILVAGYLARQRGNSFLAGLVFGCLIFKPHMALALPFCFIATRDWKVILGGIISAISIFTTRLNGLSLGPVFLIGLMIYAILRTREENQNQTL